MSRFLVSRWANLCFALWPVVWPSICFLDSPGGVLTGKEFRAIIYATPPGSIDEVKLKATGSAKKKEKAGK